MAENEVWEIDLENWNLEEQCIWGEALKAAENNYSPRVLIPVVAKVVKRWPFSGDPSNPKAYPTLSVKQWKETFKRVNDALTTFLQS